MDNLGHRGSCNFLNVILGNKKVMGEGEEGGMLQHAYFLSCFPILDFNCVSQNTIDKTKPILD